MDECGKWGVGPTIFFLLRLKEKQERCNDLYHMTTLPFMSYKYVIMNTKQNKFLHLSSSFISSLLLLTQTTYKSISYSPTLLSFSFLIFLIHIKLKAASVQVSFPLNFGTPTCFFSCQKRGYIILWRKFLVDLAQGVRDGGLCR